jgi:two-component system sensor histidine kinase EvgS
MHRSRPKGSDHLIALRQKLCAKKGALAALHRLVWFFAWLVLGSTSYAATHAPVNLTPEESQWIADHPVIQVGVYAGNHFPIEAWVAGAPDGFGVDYAKRLAGRVGLRLQFRPFSNWDDVAFDDGGKPVPFDLLLGQPYGRSSRLDYLKPYLESGFVLVARKGDLQIVDEGSLIHARIATERFGKYFTKRVKERFPDATLVFADDAHQALDMVGQGQADAFIGTSVRTRWLLSERERDDLSILTRLPDLGGVRAALAVPRGEPLLTSILGKAQASISDDELANIKGRWGLDADLSAPTPHGRRLTDDDRRWLATLGTIRVGYETDRYPYSFMDKDGTLNGLASDYLSLIRSELGLRLEFVPARDLDELQRRVAAKEVDVVAAAMPTDYDPSLMTFTHPYERFPEVIVARVGGPAIAGPEDLRGKKAAVREEAGLVDSLQMLMPKTRLVPVASNEAGLNWWSAARYLPTSVPCPPSTP